jgi:hypothetical protein
MLWRSFSSSSGGCSFCVIDTPNNPNRPLREALEGGTAAWDVVQIEKLRVGRFDGDALERRRRAEVALFLPGACSAA